MYPVKLITKSRPIGAIIVVPEKRRSLREDKIEQLMSSIRRDGLLNPITIDVADYLVAGYHRLEACKRLGYTHIDCRVVVDPFRDGKMERRAEITENLHRVELSTEERDELIRKYAALTGQETGSSEPVSKGGRGNKGTATKVAAELGVSKSTVRRALNPAVRREEKKDAPTVGMAEPPKVKPYDAMVAAWDAADAHDHERFLKHIGAVRGINPKPEHQPPPGPIAPPLWRNEPKPEPEPRFPKPVIAAHPQRRNKPALLAGIPATLSTASVGMEAVQQPGNAWLGRISCGWDGHEQARKEPPDAQKPPA